MSGAMDQFAMAKVARLEPIIGYALRDPGVGWEALQVAGSGVISVRQIQGGVRRITHGNKRLAILGDTAINHVLSEQWFNSGDSKAEWTKIREDIASNEGLAQLGWDSGLADLLNVNPMNPVPPTMRLVSDLVEAVIGAVDLDGGIDAVKQVMRTLGLLDQVAQEN
ncbi:hypothetical protein AAFC00_000221 [Neodothiora populina]|uniref:RNase III domain-containing protein n=1 Tax=Neodothiora populina TaxID=2781224 RepID=A0ABR3P373_9PEZI